MMYIILNINKDCFDNIHEHVTKWLSPVYHFIYLTTCTFM